MPALPNCMFNEISISFGGLGQRKWPWHLRDKTTVLQPFMDVTLFFVQHDLLAPDFRLV